MVLQVRATFPEILIREPIIHNLSQNFLIVTNILAADVQSVHQSAGGGIGWVLFDMTGEEEELEKGLQWMIDIGVEVERVFRFNKDDSEE